MERRKKEEAERKAKLDEIAEKQRQRERELEEKERRRKEELLGKSFSVPTRAIADDPAARAVEAAPAAAAAAPSTGKYVPKFKRMAAEGAVPPPETDKWSRPDDRADRWRDDRRGGGAPRSTWQSSRAR